MGTTLPVVTEGTSAGPGPETVADRVEKRMGKAARTAIAYVQLVYGRQLQQPSDEAIQADPLHVSQMTRDQRGARPPVPPRRSPARDPSTARGVS